MQTICIFGARKKVTAVQTYSGTLWGVVLPINRQVELLHSASIQRMTALSLFQVHWCYLCRLWSKETIQCTASRELPAVLHDTPFVWALLCKLVFWQIILFLILTMILLLNSVLFENFSSRNDLESKPETRRAKVASHCSINHVIKWRLKNLTRRAWDLVIISMHMLAKINRDQAPLPPF